MSMYDQFKTDGNVEKDGVWLDYGDFRILVSRAGGANKDFQKQVERLTRPYRRAIATESLPVEVADTLMKKAYAKAVIRDWQTKVDGEFQQGIENPDGDELLPFNQDNIIATFELLPELYADITQQASNWAIFKASLREDSAGN